MAKTDRLPFQNPVQMFFPKLERVATESFNNKKSEGSRNEWVIYTVSNCNGLWHVLLEILSGVKA